MAIAAHGERGRNAAGRAGVTLCYAECCEDVTTVGLGLQAGGAEPRGLAARQGILEADCLATCFFMAPFQGLTAFTVYLQLSQGTACPLSALVLVSHWELHFPEFLPLKD